MTECTVFVRGVPEKVQRKDFMDAFGAFGEIREVRFPPARMFKGQKIRRDFGFVEYAKEEECKKAIEKGTVTLGDVSLSLSAARPKRRWMKDTAFVLNIPQGTTEKMLQDIFAKYNVISIKIPKFNEEGKRGFAFVKFDTEEHFDSAMAAGKVIQLNGEESSLFPARPPWAKGRRVKNGRRTRSVRRAKKAPEGEKEAAKTEDKPTASDKPKGRRAQRAKKE